jgi:6-phosphogluconate dehydrogenase (decarboxylating)
MDLGMIGLGRMGANMVLRGDFAGKLVSAMRLMFGGHLEQGE